MALVVKNCKACNSPNSGYYTRLRYGQEDGRRHTFKELAELAKAKGESISHEAFRRHFSKHLQQTINRHIEADERIRGLVQERLNSDIQSVEEIGRNLDMCKELVVRLTKMDLTPQTAFAIKGLITEIRLTLDMVYKLRKEMALDNQIDKNLTIKECTQAIVEAARKAGMEPGMVIEKAIEVVKNGQGIQSTSPEVLPVV